MIMFNENANDDDDDTAAIKMRVNFFYNSRSSIT